MEGLNIVFENSTHELWKCLWIQNIYFLCECCLFARQFQLVLEDKHKYEISTCLLCAPKHREKYKIWKTIKKKCANNKILSNTGLKQINRCILNPGIYHQGQSLHVYYGLAFDMNEKGKISVSYLYSAYSIWITNLLRYNQQHLYLESALWNLHIDFKAFDMTGINPKHILCLSLERWHSVCMLVVVRQNWW